ncbi:MAG: nuclear transport factor 2 family protein [Dermatophilaceae bacterium]
MTAEIDQHQIAGRIVDERDALGALIRFTEGLDRSDAGILASAFTDDAVADFTPAAERVGMSFPMLTGRDTIVTGLIGSIGPLDTSHSVTNARATVSEDSAVLTAYVEAQHFPPGEGPQPATERHLLMKNTYRVELERGDADWRISRMTVDNLWTVGDLTVITGDS